MGVHSLLLMLSQHQVFGDSDRREQLVAQLESRTVGSH